jgi:hypothetical protein
MNRQTLKELKPPFHYHIGGRAIHNSDDNIVLLLGHVLSEKDDDIDRFFTWLVTYLNEKVERDCGEPLRWIPKENGKSRCPACLLFTDYSNLVPFKYCPNCGKRIHLPE